MKTYKTYLRPRATWTACSGIAVLAIGALLTLAATIIAILAVWTESDKLNDTALLIGMLSLGVCGFGVLIRMNHEHGYSFSHCTEVTIPLPWRAKWSDLL